MASRLGRGFPVSSAPGALAYRTASAAPTKTVTIDSIGSGGLSNGTGGTSVSWQHYVSGNAVVVGMNYYNTSSVAVPGSVKIGTKLLNLLGNTQFYNPSVGYVTAFLYGLLNPPTGLQTLSCTMSGTNGVATNSVSYFNVGGFGLYQVTTGTTTTASQTVTAGSNSRIFNIIISGNNNPTGYSQNQLYSVAGSPAVYPNCLIGDAAGNASVTFSATVPSGGGGWASAAVPLINPWAVIADTTPATQTYYNEPSAQIPVSVPRARL